MSNRDLKSDSAIRRTEDKQETANEVPPDALERQNVIARPGKQKLRTAIISAAVRFAHELADIIEGAREFTEHLPQKRLTSPPSYRPQGEASGLDRVRGERALRRAGFYTAGGKR